MYVLASVRIALRALRVNKLRSALTMLGIIIGVGAVIAMVSVGTGAAARIEEQIASIGSNLLVVLPGTATSGAYCINNSGQIGGTSTDSTGVGHAFIYHGRPLPRQKGSGSMNGP